MKFLLCAAAIAAALCVAQPAAAKGEAGYQVNAAHDGRATFKKPFKGPLKMKWKRDLGAIMSYPFAGNGMVFVTVFLSSGAQLYALDERTGATIWHKTVYNHDGSVATYDKGAVFVVNNAGLLQAFKADSVGSPLWNVQLPGSNGFDGPPTAYKGRIYLDTYPSVIVVNEKTGAYVRHEYQGGHNALAVGPDGVYLSTDHDQIKYDPKTLDILWDYGCRCGSSTFANPSYFNGLFYGQGEDGGVVLKADTGALVHSFSSDYPVAFWVPKTGDPVGVAVNSNLVHSFDTVTGNEGWDFADPQHQGFSTPALVINDTVAVGSSGGTLYLLDAATGTLQWSTPVGAPIGSPIFNVSAMGVSDGKLLIPAGSTLSAWVAGK